MFWLIAAPIVLGALYLWVIGHPFGVFTGFLPVMAGSFAVAFAIMESEPTPKSSFWALCAGLALTVLPLTLRLVREQSVAEKKRRRDFSGGDGNANGRIGL